MKKIAFPIIVVLLVASIAALVGYNSLVIQNRGQEVLSQQPTTETNEPTTNYDRSECSGHLLYRR